MRQQSNTWQLDTLESFLEKYSSVEGYQQRQAAFHYIEKHGFPVRKTENWKYLDLFSLYKKELSITPIVDLSLEEINPFQLSGMDCLVFVDGYFSEALSCTDYNNALQIEPISVVSDMAMQTYLNTQNENHAFLALNHALFQSGLKITVPENVQLSHPVQLLFIQSGQHEHVMSHTHCEVFAKAHSEAVFFETYLSLSDKPCYLNNVSVTLALDEAASVMHYRYQGESRSAYHIGFMSVDLASSSRFKSFQVSHGAQMSRGDTLCHFNGSGARAAIYGILQGADTQALDHHTDMHHKVAGTNSKQIHKSLLSESSQGVFNGRIKVQAGADQTEAHLSTPNLLLSPNAQVNAKPELEIYADDVKCTHGATMGCLDEKALFYLRSRGIPLADAKRMLTEAFLDEIFDHMRHAEIKQFIKGMMNDVG